ncbi:hypothetical protein GCM10023149_17110 [Mucilaginibacter gynuensis]|uniref:PKD domain-containing protein n=1 Tax=Mucilaginibacter gynuensis TaxID=1302236 RepID=A0ABP8G747_9SPHI
MFRALLLLILFFFAENSFAQSNTSNKGTEFWTAYMEHYYAADASERPSQMALYITSDVNTSGRVELANGAFSLPYTVRANQVTIVDIPVSAYIRGPGQSLKGIHITAGKPVAVYAHIYAKSVSGATLLLPVNTLGKKYISINYTQKSNAEGERRKAFSTILVVATEDNTQVVINPTQQLTDGKPANQPFNVFLKKGEVYQVDSETDLTGSTVNSFSTTNEPCKKIAVFSGSTKIGIGCVYELDKFSSDNLFQQVYPTAAWGKNYITVPLASRTFDIYRIVLSDPQTEVKLNGAVVTPNTGSQFIELILQGTQYITADKPIQVAQYAVTQGQTFDCRFSGGDIGDPEMIYLNPLEQTIDHVTLYSTDKDAIKNNFINVVIKTTAVSSFVLDGSPYTIFEPIQATNNEYSYAQISVGVGTHNISAQEGFNAIAYGFGNNESYGYAAGTNLANLNERVVLHDPITGESVTAGCVGTSYKLQLTLPYKTNTISWDFGDGTTAGPFNDPPFTTKEKDGKTLYVYEYHEQTYSIGDHVVMAKVFNPTGDDCGSTEEVEFDFNVANLPVAAFDVTANCAGVNAIFNDKSAANGTLIKAWLWQFDDGTTSDQQNPEHIFNTAGDHTITLTVTNENGCTDVISKVVNFKPLPVVGFNTSAMVCSGKEIEFTGTGNALNTITKWIWDFGDGTISEALTVNTVKHTYAAPGVYPVKVTAENTNGCISISSRSVDVGFSPDADFTMAQACVNDPAQFTYKNLIATQNDATFTFKWDFGDAGSGALNASTDRNPSHRYATPGTYDVKLTVTTQQGCVVERTNRITINGDQFAGGFSVEDQDRLCSNRDVVFINNATVNVGSIVRVEWYFDLDGHPNDKEVYTIDNMPADGKYTHKYDTFTLPESKPYRVKMVVYSGENCSREFELPITVYAQPYVALSPTGNIVVCEDDAPLTFGQTENGTLISGGTFTGRGVSSTGVFDPKVAGPGIFEINYTYLSGKGCDFNTTFNVMVNALPKIDVKPQYTFFEGGQVLITAQASGASLVYKWSPSIGLSNPDILQPTANPAVDTKYQLTVSSGACETTVDVFVKVLRKIIVPNTFSPNGDGANDTWKIQNIEDYPNCLITIFNRYGDKVYTSTGYGNGWNGTRNGAGLPTATYYYIIDLKDGHKPVSGNVTILR